MEKTLIACNGMYSNNVGGGDIFTLKFINLSKIKKDVILSGNAGSFVYNKQNNSVFQTISSFSGSLLILIWIYLVRIIQSVYIIKKQKNDYNLAIASSPFLFDLFPLIFAKSGKKAVILYHTIPERKAVGIATSIRFFIASLERKMAYSIIRRYFDLIITGNNIEKEKLIGYFPGKAIIVADAGFDSSKIDNIKSEKKDKNLACFIGRLTTQKGILDLADIMKKINEKCPDFRLIIIGDGPDKKLLLDKIKRSKINSIIVKGFVNESEKYRLLKKSKFFFFPSYEEGWGIALAEALYCNCICLCYKLPHYNGIFGNSLIYIEKGNVKKFIEKFMKNYDSQNKKSKQFIRRYDDKNVIKELEKSLN